MNFYSEEKYLDLIKTREKHHYCAKRHSHYSLRHATLQNTQEAKQVKNNMGRQT